MMIAYKVFREVRGRLYSWYRTAYEVFSYFPEDCIIIRAENCGPYACCKTLSQAKFWAEDRDDTVIHRVRIKESKARMLWIDNNTLSIGPNTILADEFEILEEVK